MSDEPDIQAAEYVLGTLSADERRDVAARAESDPALRAVPVTAGKDLELWALPPGATRPVALGVLPASGRVPAAVPGQGAQLMISLEPAGGSPTGLPTGPVLFAGTLKGT